jgi:hypothetical protein
MYGEEEEPKYKYIEGEEKRIEFIERTAEWMFKFLDDFKEHRNAARFPESAFADQSISSVEDMATQIAIKAAEIQEARATKE